MPFWVVLTQETPNGQARVAVSQRFVRAVWDAGEHGAVVGLADAPAITVVEPFEKVLEMVRLDVEAA